TSISTTPTGKKIDKIEKLIIDVKVSFVYDKGKSFKKIGYPGDHDSDTEVEPVDNEMTSYLASERVHFSNNSLLEQWRDTHQNADYDYDPYDDAMYEGQEIPDNIQSICDNLDIKLRGQARHVEESHVSFWSLCKTSSEHKESHLIPVKRIFRYLKVEVEDIAADGCYANILWIKSQLTDYDIIYEKCSTSRSKDEEYAMAVRDFKKFFKRKDKSQRAFVEGSWSDSGEEDDEKVNNKTYLVAKASSEVYPESSYISDENSSIDELVLDNEDDKLCKMSLKIITKNQRLKVTRNNFEKELSVQKEKVSTLEKNKGVDLECVKRLGHANMRLIQSLESKELVRNLPKLKFDQHVCDACKIRKKAHTSHKAKNIVSSTRCLEILYMDLFGPSAVRSYEGNRYTLVIVDDYSRYTWTRLLKDKAKAFDQFKIFSKKIQNQLGCTTVLIRIDHSREFDNEVQFGEFCNANGTKWVFRNKLDENGIVSKNKARILLAYACALDFKLIQLDVKSAFLNGFINEEVYVAQPPGFIDFEKPDHVYKLKKALYSLKQAPKAWYDRLKSFLIKHEYKMEMVDNTLFTKKKSSNLIIIQIYVDDIIFGSTCQDMCDEFAKIMHDEFEMRMMGELNFFIFLQIKQMEDGIFFNQSKYIKEILKKFGLEESKPMKTPMSFDTKLTKDEEYESVDSAKYRGMIGSLLYLTASRPDVTLKQLSVSSDTLKKQTALTISATEAEYVSARKACQQALWMKQDLIDYDVRLNDVSIMCYNKGVIDLRKNPVQHSQTKHIEIHHHFLCDNVQEGHISIEKVPSVNTIADIPKRQQKFGPLKHPPVLKLAIQRKEKSSSAMDSNLSQPLVSTPVTHKEDQQATCALTSLEVTSKAKAKPQLSSDQTKSVSEGLEHIISQPIIGKRASSIAIQVEEEEAFSIIKLEDLANSLPTELKDLPFKINEVIEEVKGLKIQVHELEIEPPGGLKEIPTYSMVESSRRKKPKKFDFITEDGRHIHLTKEEINQQKKLEEDAKSKAAKQEGEVRKAELVDLLGPEW
nr:copia protein [Tanacetum cinerariifolium]